MITSNQTNHMTFVDALIASGYRFDDGENYDDAWVKNDSEGFMHFYFEGEDEGEWNYVKMTSDYDVVIETTVNVDDTCTPISAN